MLQKYLKSLEIYKDRRMLSMLGLGFSSGFPFLLVGGTLSLWLKSCGFGFALIGFFAVFKTPYSFKWLWSPLIDHIKLPLLTPLLGRRRGWAFLTQILLLAAFLLISVLHPDPQNWQMTAFAVTLAVFFSASQDIVIDSFRIDSFEEQKQGAASAVFVLGYRIGMIFSGAFALMLSDYLSWNQVYAIMSCGALVGIAAILCSSEPQKDRRYEESLFRESNIPAWQNFWRNAVAAPFKDFCRHYKWPLILLFIMLFRLGDDYKGPMANVFYNDMGFTNTQIGYISKLYGMMATIFGGIIGGILTARKGLARTLIISGILQGVTNLIYIMQAHIGNNIYMLGVTICADSLAGGMATTALVAYLSSLCNVRYTATQYALLSSLMSLPRDILASTSGCAAQYLGWSNFFLLSAILVIPALMLLGYMIKAGIIKK